MSMQLLPRFFGQSATKRRGQRAFAPNQLTIVPSHVVREALGPTWREQLMIALTALPILIGLGALAILRYGVYEPDALARVYSAARTVRGNRPALANVGFIWPPLPTLVEIPFALFDSLITTGLAAVALFLVYVIVDSSQAKTNCRCMARL